MEQEKISNFIDSLGLPSQIANVLFESWDDCVLFVNKFYNRNARVTDDLLDFRDLKISTSNKNLDSFIFECKIGKLKPTFEKTFYQSFNDFDIDLIQKSINLGNISLEILFKNFIKNPNKNIMRYVL